MNSKLLKNVLVIVVILILVSIAGYLFLKKYYSTSNEIPYTDLSVKMYCINDFKSDKELLVVNNNGEYHNLLKYKISVGCDKFELPDIDFVHYTLIGSHLGGSGCSVNFVRKVTEDNSNKVINYTVDTITSGPCDQVVSYPSWILIPKVPSDYSIKLSGSVEHT